MIRRRLLVIATLGMAALIACSQSPTPNQKPNNNTNAVTVRGVINLGVNGPSNAQVRPAAIVPESAISITSPNAFSNVDNGTSIDISGTFTIIANQTFSNLTLYAIGRSGNLGGTAFNTVFNFGGDVINNPAFTQKIRPTHGMTNATTVNANKADLQFLHISEALFAQQQAQIAGYLNSGDEILEYGYVARRCIANCASATPTWTRAFAPGDSGEITIAIRVPKGATSVEDPYRFFMSFAIANEPIMRFTKSIEEGTAAGSHANLAARATAVGGTNAKEVAFVSTPNGVIGGCTSCTAIQFDNIRTSTAPTYVVTPAAGTVIVSGVIKAPYVTAGSPEALGIPKEAEFAEGQAIVKFKTAQAQADTIQALAVTDVDRLYGQVSVLNASNATTSSSLDGVQAASAAAVNTLEFIAELRGRPDVEWAVPNYIDRINATPNDPLYPIQSTVTNPNNIWHYTMANIPTAWDITTGSSSVRVAVLDTGILYNKNDYIANDSNSTREPNTNPDLYCSTNRWRPGYDFVSYDNTSDNDALDDDDPYDLGPYSGTNFHGTHVAGTIGACTDNNVGIAGVTWGVEMMSVRVLGPQGGQRSDIIRGMLWAAGIAVQTTTSTGTNTITNPFPADLLNMSLGGRGVDQAYQDAIDQINAAGKVLVVSAGNNNDNSYNYAPAGQNGVITVASVGPTTNAPAAPVPRRAFYSNYGSAVEIAAPGGDLVTAPVTPRGVLSTQGCNGNGQGQPDPSTGCTTWGYTEFQGTSMSAPHIVGILALMNSARVASNLPKLNIMEATYYLQSTATPLGAANDCSNGCGAGLVDTVAAINAAVANGFNNAFLQFQNPFSSVTGRAGLDFDTSDTTGTLTLQNVGTVGGNFTLSTSNAALTATVGGNVSGAISASGTVTVDITLNRTGVTDGAYLGTIYAMNGTQVTTAPVYYIQGMVSNNMGRLLIEALRWNNATGFDLRPGRSVMRFVPGIGYPYRFTQMTQNRRFVIQSYTEENGDGRSEYYRCYPSATSCSVSATGTFAVDTTPITNLDFALSTASIGISTPF